MLELCVERRDLLAPQRPQVPGRPARARADLLLLWGPAPNAGSASCAPRRRFWGVPEGWITVGCLARRVIDIMNLMLVRAGAERGPAAAHAPVVHRPRVAAGGRPELRARQCVCQAGRR